MTPPDWSDLKDGVTGHGLTDQLRLALLRGDALDSLPKPEFLIEDVVPLGVLLLVYGPSGVGKSFVAMGMGLCTAAGRPWLGHRVRRGAVLYVAAEGHFGLAQRRRAWMTDEGVANLDGDLWIPRSINLLDPSWATALVDIALEVSPAFIVLDTVARSMVGGDENSSRDMGAVITAVDDLRSATGATVGLVHHMPRSGENPRGHSSLEGAADTMIEIKPDDPGFSLRCTKQKDAIEFRDIHAQLKVVGDSCVVVEIDPRGSKTLTEQGRQCLEALAAVDVGGGVSTSVWRLAVNAPERTFFRTIKRLVDDGYCHLGGTEHRPKYSLTDQGQQEIQ